MLWQLEKTSSHADALTKYERELLSDSFHPQRLRRRARGVILSAAVVLVGVLALTRYGVSVPWFVAITVVVLLVSALEKLLYHRTMRNYESLILKLTHRIEHLEGVPLTPEQGEPIRSAQNPETG